jgi:hypothetical protein
MIVPNVHASLEDKIGDVKGSFYVELERKLIPLGHLNTKGGKEDILKPTIWNESLHEMSNDNGVGLINFATSKTPE